MIEKQVVIFNQTKAVCTIFNKPEKYRADWKTGDNFPISLPVLKQPRLKQKEFSIAYYAYSVKKKVFNLSLIFHNVYEKITPSE